MEPWTLHPTLATDTHRIARRGSDHLLLHRNAAIPWLILVPESSARDLSELEEFEALRISGHAHGLARWMRSRPAVTKVNVAAIGNLVPQLHVHVVGRSPADPFWPRPVWGHLGPRRVYAAAELEAIATSLRMLGWDETDSAAAFS